MLKVPKVENDHTQDTITEMGSIRRASRSRDHSISSSPLEENMDQFKPLAFYCLDRESRPRIWFISLMCWPWFERISILVILINCVTLGMYDPFDTNCETKQCKVLETMETCIYTFFLVEMLVKWMAMGLFGKQGYFKDSWNRLDCFIVAAGSFELAYGEGEYLSAVRSIRVLRPLRAINRVPSIRILVMLLLDTLPMLGNVLAICFFIFAIFGIIGVQLWQGLLRSRCYPDELNETIIAQYNLSEFYRPSFNKPDYVCSLPGNAGLSQCKKQYFKRYMTENMQCNMTFDSLLNYSLSSSSTCVNWNQYYTTCRESGENINYGLISFDNIGIATVAIFQIITLEGWTDIMYNIQDTHSFWNWLYFVVLILLASYFMTNLCLVVITSQFQETKQRETELMKRSRLRSRASVSTMSSNYMQQGCYTQILQYLEYLCRRLKRRVRVTLKIEKPQKRRVNPCLPLKGGRENVKSVHHHHHHHHYYHHFVHQSPCQCHDVSESPPSPNEPLEPSCKTTHDKEEQRNTKEGKRILVVPQIQVVSQAASMLYKDSSIDGPGEMVSTATANINIAGGHGSTASVITYSQTADSVALAAQATAQTLETACSCAMQQKEQNLSVVREGYDSVDSSEDDDERNVNKTRRHVCARKFKKSMTSFVESTRFTRVIMASIFLNTMCMAIEHHGEPVKMTEVLEILNIIFTSVFALEMLAKIIAFGPYGYIKDPFNLFDGIIVIVSLMDVFAGNNDSGISVLRSFRLLRIFKLVRFMPALQRQLRVMIRTLDNVMTFLVLLSLFIFTASILGMHLFGAKYSFKNEEGKLVAARANFDTLFWALVTVFQVLTQEDWNVVLYDGMRATSSWAALYFIFLMTIGNYILFNLLVAILVEGFADQTEENERVLVKPEKVSTNSFVKVKKNTEPSYKVRVENEKNVALSCPNINANFEDQTTRHKPISRCNSAPGRESIGGSRKSTCYPHVLTVDGLKMEKSSDGTGTEDEDISLVPVNDIPCNNDDTISIVTNTPSWFSRRSTWSLFLFSPNNSFRKLMVKIHSNVWFDRVILFFILFNCIVMALEEPGLDSHSKTAEFIYIMQYIFTAIFTIEMIIKVISLGLFLGPKTYLRSGWNVVDGILVLFSLVDLIISLATSTHSGILGVLRVFRAFRTVRPLRVINRAPELKLVVETLLSSLKPIGNVVLIAATFFTIFGILGVQLFKGAFYSCDGAPSSVEIQNKTDCISHSGNWINNEYNFDHLPRALLTLFVFATRDGWVSIMYSGVDTVGVDKQPQRNHSKWLVLYFISFLLLAGFVVLNMLVGVVVENFHKCRNQLLREQNALKKETKRLDENIGSDSFESVDFESFSPFRQKLFHLVVHEYFDLAIAVIIGINVLFMTMEHYDQPEDLTLFLKYANYLFTIMFVLEAALKIIALGAKAYFQNRWNCLDMLIVVLSIGGIILDELATSNFPINPTIIRVMRVLRITRVLKLLKTADGIRSLLDTVGKALPQVANLGLLFLLLFFIFGALGMELFGDISCEVVECEGLDTHAHFKNFGYSMLTLFRVSTGDNWNGILKDTINSKRCIPDDSVDGCKIIQNVAPVYFAAFVLITQFVLLNVVVAVMMKHLEEAKFTRNQELLVNTRDRSSSRRIPRVFLETEVAHTPNMVVTSPETPRPINESEVSKKQGCGIPDCEDKKEVFIFVDNEKERTDNLETAPLDENNLRSAPDFGCTSKPNSTNPEESIQDNDLGNNDFGRCTKIVVDVRGDNSDKTNIGEHSNGKVGIGGDQDGHNNKGTDLGNMFDDKGTVHSSYLELLKMRNSITLVRPLEDEETALRTGEEKEIGGKDTTGLGQELVKDVEEGPERVRDNEQTVGHGDEKKRPKTDQEMGKAGRKERLRVPKREGGKQKIEDRKDKEGEKWKKGDKNKQRKENRKQDEEEKEVEAKPGQDDEQLKEEQEDMDKQERTEKQLQHEKQRKKEELREKEGQVVKDKQGHEDLGGHRQDQRANITQDKEGHEEEKDTQEKEDRSNSRQPKPLREEGGGKKEEQGQKRRQENKEKDQKSEDVERRQQAADQNCEDRQRGSSQKSVIKDNDDFKMKSRAHFHGIRLEPLPSLRNKLSEPSSNT